MKATVQITGVLYVGAMARFAADAEQAIIDLLASQSPSAKRGTQAVRVQLTITPINESAKLEETR